MEWWYGYHPAARMFAILLGIFFLVGAYRFLTDQTFRGDVIVRILMIGGIFVVLYAIGQCSSGPAVIPDPPRHR
jgi:multisubunit Na+/H+ antiporter MnhC subunit